jgi:hypothetical protein
MIYPWFTQEVALRFTLFSFFSLLAGLGVYVEQGRHRAAVTGGFVAGLATGVILLALAVRAGVVGQPHYVLFALSVPAVVLSVVFSAVLASLPNRYAAARLRRSTPKEFRAA